MLPGRTRIQYQLSPSEWTFLRGTEEYGCPFKEMLGLLIVAGVYGLIRDGEELLFQSDNKLKITVAEKRSAALESSDMRQILIVPADTNSDWEYCRLWEVAGWIDPDEFEMKAVNGLVSPAGLTEPHVLYRLMK